MRYRGFDEAREVLLTADDLPGFLMDVRGGA